MTIVVAAMVLATLGTAACSPEFDAVEGPCRFDDLGLEPPTDATTSTTGAPATATTVLPPPTIVQLSVSNDLGEFHGRVLLSVDSTGVARATGEAGGGVAQLDEDAMARLTGCFTDDGFTELDADYPDQMSPKDGNGHFCGINDASEYTIAVQGIAAPKTVTAYALDLDPDECDLGHPEALEQVYAALTDLREQVAARGH